MSGTLEARRVAQEDTDDQRAVTPTAAPNELVTPVGGPPVKPQAMAGRGPFLPIALLKLRSASPSRSEVAMGSTAHFDPRQPGPYSGNPAFRIPSASRSASSRRGSLSN